MGISSILSAALKHIPMDQVATIALQYGPDFIKKLKDKIQSSETNEKVNEGELFERIQELESAILKQEEIIEQQNRSILLLEVQGKTLQARLIIFMTVSSVSALLSLALLLIMLRK